MHRDRLSFANSVVVVCMGCDVVWHATLLKHALRNPPNRSLEITIRTERFRVTSFLNSSHLWTTLSATIEQLLFTTPCNVRSVSFPIADRVQLPVLCCFNVAQMAVCLWLLHILYILDFDRLPCENCGIFSIDDVSTRFVALSGFLCLRLLVYLAGGSNAASCGWHSPARLLNNTESKRILNLLNWMASR